MSKPHIHFRRIGWRQTREVIDLSRSLLPAELCRKPHSLLALFINLERRNHNLSFGLYCGDELVGYMLVYFHGRSLYHQRDEKIVHIDEYCVKPDFRGRGRDVISRMVHEMDVWQARSGIEAIATGEALQHWLSIGRLVSRWGYETHLRENDCMRGGHQMGRIRWEFISTEYWRPETPQKLPKPVSTAEVHGSTVELLLIRSTRQWLSLKESYEKLNAAQSKGSAGEFNYQWEYWRHFGIEEELCIAALRQGEEIQAIMPMSVKADRGDASRVSYSLIASNSLFATAAPIYSPAFSSTAEQLIQQCLSTANLPIDVKSLSSGSDTTSFPNIPASWLGFNRRTAELHLSFQERVGKNLK